MAFRRVLALLIVAGVMAALPGRPAAGSATATPTAAPPVATPGPTGYLGIVTISGQVYAAVDHWPLDAVWVDLIHTQLIQGPTPVGSVITAVTDDEGRYTLGPVALRDTDGIIVRVQAAGYQVMEIRMGGLEVFRSGGHGFNFPLLEADTATPTVTTTRTPTAPPDLTRTTATPTVDLSRTTATPSLTPTRTPSRTPTLDLTRFTATPTPNFTRTSPTPTPTATPT